VGEAAGSGNAGSVSPDQAGNDGVLAQLGLMWDSIFDGSVSSGAPADVPSNIVGEVTDAASSVIPSSTSITVWLVLIVIALLAFAYITREVGI
jgi:hypothetical protein